ncbi:MAG TPA: hypothetical protein VMU79_13215 [Casimicrobiaceae bacterium]|nr:hypothetical protein [Casimicrobiaceae bacterium]
MKSRRGIPSTTDRGPVASSPLIKTERIYGANNYEPLPVVMAHGEGVWLWDEHGRR